MKGSKSTAAAEHLFATSDLIGKKLDTATIDLFHYMIIMTLYLRKRARPDQKTPTAFLCTRVKAPDEHDWKNLAQMMKHLQAINFLPLILKSRWLISMVHMHLMWT